MCRAGAEGGRRCNEHANVERRRRARKADRQSQAQDAVRALIGATPYRPESEQLVAMSSRSSYYESDEWQEWSDRIQVVAERHGVVLVEGTPQQQHADGIWEGDTEPSGAYVVEGSREAITAWAGDVAGYYNQDAVMVLFADDAGRDRLFTLEVGSRDSEAVMSAMKEADIPGGRIVEGRLEVVSTHDAAIGDDQMNVLRARLGASEFGETPVACSFVEKNEGYLPYTPIKEIQGIRQRHAEKHGLPVRPRAPHLTDADGMAMARAYLEGEHAPDDPKVKRSYRTFRQHIQEQYNELTAAGYTFEPWDGHGPGGRTQEQPYPDSVAMMADLRENKHLYFFRTEVSQGSAGALPESHPMNAPMTVRDKHGRESKVIANDAFRAVHDAIAHSEGHKFGPHGERMAWWAHRSSLPREAHLALFNETIGQNAVTNFGPHMQVDDGAGGLRLLRHDEEGFLPIPHRPYAPQKCVRVPDELT